MNYQAEVSGKAGAHRSPRPRPRVVHSALPTPSRCEVNEPASTTKPERRCELCHAPLRHKRTDALYCSPSHRAEASRLRRLRNGQQVDGYATLAAYVNRGRRRTDGS
jgi:hypothetical protein